MKNMHHLPLILTTAAILPMAFMSCSPLESTPVFSSLCLAYSNLSKAGEASSVDLFIYDAFAPYLLDSYQHFDGIPQSADVISTCGEKILSGVSIPSGERLSYEDFKSYEDLCSAVAFLAEEDPSRPTMSGCIRFKADGWARGTLTLNPLLCKISLKSVSLELDKEIYGDRKMSFHGAYLINVSGICHIMEGNDSTVSELVNGSRYDPYATSRLNHPEMLYSKNVSGAVFHCFPGDGRKEDEGGRPTRLVVEAEMDSVTYYYPITLPHMKRGTEYTYCLTITRTGCLDPDIPAKTGSVTVNLSTKKWKEYENETVDY